MPSDPLFGVTLKIDRAKKHLRDLESEIQTFLDRGPFRTLEEDDPDCGDLLIKLKILEVVPAEWSTIIGDTIHNLRSALDHLACELVIVNDRVVTNDTAFPIAENIERFNSIVNRYLDGASDTSITLVKSFNPFKEGNHDLWCIHKLDIIDKHRSILPAVAARAGTSAAVASSGSNLEVPALSPTTTKLFSPIRDGMVLFRFGSIVRDLNCQIAYKFAYSIAFGETGIVDGKDVVPTLKHLVEVVESVVSTFRHNIFSQ